MKLVPRVVFTCFPMRNRGYFEWLYTGLQVLEQQGLLEIVHEGSGWDLLLRRRPRVYGKLQEYFPGLGAMLSPVDYFALAGRYEYGGKSVTFAYDVTDSPFTYALAWLERVDRYFKMQCPKTFDAEGFPLSTKLRVPYHPDVLTFQDKIRPTMSTGGITSTLDLKRNLGVLERDRARASEARELRMFASFGSDQGPKPWAPSELPPAPHNYRNERTLLSLYGERIQHPNEKRGALVRRLRKWGMPDVDARIWSSEDPGIQGDALGWEAYLYRVSQSAYNVNVTGFRRSAPFRIIDSLRMGCGVASDNLAVKWYRQFAEDLEMVEIGELGYEAAGDVDWDGVEVRLREAYDEADLGAERRRQLLALFDEKWHPSALGRYFVEEMEAALQG